MKGAGAAAEIEAATKQIRAFKLQNVERFSPWVRSPR
jgi:hypothetical protein